jgi:hypothetical protein
MHWHKQLAYTITPKSEPVRQMETLLDADQALVRDSVTGLTPGKLHLSHL